MGLGGLGLIRGSAFGFPTALGLRMKRLGSTPVAEQDSRPSCPSLFIVGVRI